MELLWVPIKLSSDGVGSSVCKPRRLLRLCPCLHDDVSAVNCGALFLAKSSSLILLLLLTQPVSGNQFRSMDLYRSMRIGLLPGGHWLSSSSTLINWSKSGLCKWNQFRHFDFCYCSGAPPSGKCTLASPELSPSTASLTHFPINRVYAIKAWELFGVHIVARRGN